MRIEIKTISPPKKPVLGGGEGMWRDWEERKEWDLRLV